MSLRGVFVGDFALSEDLCSSLILKLRPCAFGNFAIMANWQFSLRVWFKTCSAQVKTRFCVMKLAQVCLCLANEKKTHHLWCTPAGDFGAKIKFLIGSVWWVVKVETDSTKEITFQKYHLRVVCVRTTIKTFCTKASFQPLRGEEKWKPGSTGVLIQSFTKPLAIHPSFPDNFIQRSAGNLGLLMIEPVKIIIWLRCISCVITSHRSAARRSSRCRDLWLPSAFWASPFLSSFAVTSDGPQVICLWGKHFCFCDGHCTF